MTSCGSLSRFTGPLSTEPKSFIVVVYCSMSIIFSSVNTRLGKQIIPSPMTSWRWIILQLRVMGTSSFRTRYIDIGLILVEATSFLTEPRRFRPIYSPVILISWEYLTCLIRPHPHQSGMELDFWNFFDNFPDYDSLNFKHFAKVVSLSILLWKVMTVFQSVANI